MGPGGTGSGYGFVMALSSGQSVDVGSGLVPRLPDGRLPTHSAVRTARPEWPSRPGETATAQAATAPAAAAPAASPAAGLASTGTRAFVDSLAGAMDAWARTITSAPVTESAASVTRRR